MSTGRTDQSCSYVNKSVQWSAQTHSIQILQTDPLMISGKIAKQPTKMLIDSGASLTLINSSLFNRLPYHIRQRVEYQTGNLQLHLARDVPRPRQNRESRSRWSRSRSVSVSVVSVSVTV
ncbi:unnamed protein product [Rotaria socialis]|uniref:Peptidase A2 domain-containing protein n=1 Tax=Rotaria socialis TaxID=392032 RepID=A0A817U5H7_9BILA|nr:unnamed protein product [Rotaria socialis]CAF4358323.1 unnamed protein product [Rotaria socialis]